VGDNLVNAKRRVDAVQQPCLDKRAQVKRRGKASLRIDTSGSGEKETKVIDIAHRRPPCNYATNITQLWLCEKARPEGSSDLLHGIGHSVRAERVAGHHEGGDANSSDQ
jgi:hypothetical protein